MIRLLLETATDICSVAISRDDQLLVERTATEPHQHASHLTLLIQQALQAADISLSNVTEVTLSDGPGSYTSLRVGAATAKGLCLARPHLQLRAVPTLFALAQAATTPENICLPTINSRRGEVFGQLWKGTRPLSPILNIRLEGDDQLAPHLAGQTAPIIIACGPGQERFRGASWLQSPLYTNLKFAPPPHCSAALLLAPASAPITDNGSDSPRLVDVATYEPRYLNPPFVTRSKKKPLG